MCMRVCMPLFASTKLMCNLMFTKNATELLIAVSLDVIGIPLIPVPICGWEHYYMQVHKTFMNSRVEADAIYFDTSFPILSMKPLI